MGKVQVSFSFVNQEKLPLIIRPQNQQPLTAEHLVQFLNEENTLFQEQLLKHGAILFRDFQVNSPDAFLNVINACALGTVFDYDFCTVPRTKIQKGVYTSINYTQKAIPMHNEKAYDYDTPSHIYFNCAQPSETGGCTPLIDGNKLWFSLPAPLKNKLELHGVMYCRYFYGEGIKLKLIRKIGGGINCRTWMELFETQEKSVVDEILADTIYQHEWTIGNGLITKKTMPPYRHHPISGKVVWFNQCHNLNRYYSTNTNFVALKVKNPIARYIMQLPSLSPLIARFGNGEHFAKHEIATIEQLMLEQQVMTPWQKGDVMVVDNYSCLHGKTAHTGKRLILVGMSQRPTDVSNVVDPNLE
ncbi:TauD/TfdA family dioxygenase [Legionella saoudiensis]|uniref:TauD/TfdA family dioxygenase n=1 Tax=Legionella saoudiensis TaxID=1750561 RepID=UPI0007301F14|nr:TauD/TfdA family dioxygenase [Legionella saoudiensis]